MPQLLPLLGWAGRNYQVILEIGEEFSPGGLSLTELGSLTDCNGHIGQTQLIVLSFLRAGVIGMENRC